MDKIELRAYIRKLKCAMSQEDIHAQSQCLAQKLFATALYRNARMIYGYLPYNQEIRTEYILQQALSDGKRVAVPKVYGDTMRFVVLHDLSRVAPGYAGIPEPIDDKPVADDPNALVLMPGLAFDKQGHRVGYGGGFYDKFLQSEPGHPTVALAYGFQVLEQVPFESHDVGIDQVIWA